MLGCTELSVMISSCSGIIYTICSLLTLLLQKTDIRNVNYMHNYWTESATGISTGRYWMYLYYIRNNVIEKNYLFEKTEVSYDGISVCNVIENWLS